MRYLLFFAFIATQIVDARAQSEPKIDQWTLDRCVVYGVEHSPRTTVQAQRNTIARQDYRQAIAALMPNLNGSVDARFNFGRTLGEDNTYVDANSFDNSYGVYSSLTVFAGLRQINNVRLQKINRAAGRHALDTARAEVACEVIEAFFNLQYFNDMAAIAAAQLEESRLNLRQTERMTELGVKGFPDLAEMRAKEAADSYNLTAAENQRAIGVIVLKERMNFPIDETLEIEPWKYERDVAKSGQNAAEIYADAVTRLPEAMSAEASVKAAKVALQIARGERLPAISLNTGLSTGFFHLNGAAGNTSFATQFSGKRGYYVGASLSLPIFNGLSASSDVRRGKARLNIAQIERDAALRTLRTEIEQAVADMNGGAQAYLGAVRAREAAEAAHDVVRRKYEQGMVGALELHTSSNRLSQARANELRSRLTWELKKRMVDHYSGISLY